VRVFARLSAVGENSAPFGAAEGSTRGGCGP
jgi:hypothetical protein